MSTASFGRRRRERVESEHFDKSLANKHVILVCFTHADRIHIFNAFRKIAHFPLFNERVSTQSGGLRNGSCVTQWAERQSTDLSSRVDTKYDLSSHTISHVHHPRCIPLSSTASTVCIAHDLITPARSHPFQPCSPPACLNFQPTLVRLGHPAREPSSRPGAPVSCPIHTAFAAQGLPLLHRALNTLVH